MLLDREYKIPSKYNSKISLKVVPGHFATTSSHINFYMDMTTLKVRQKEAYEVAREMAKEYQYSKPIDTIVCMDGCEIIGACLAEELNKNGIMSLNQHDSLYVITPEFDGNGQMIFRDNLQPMVRGKNILLLLASATTGRTIARSLECIQYYGGIIQGISAIFSAAKEIYGEPVHCIFSTEDLPDYNTFTPSECPHCKNKEKIDAIVNGFGYSELYGFDDLPFFCYFNCFNISSKYSHVRFTLSTSILSFGVWISFISGPNETQSSSGIFPAKIPHSTPA